MLALLLTRAPALWAWFSDNSALALALGAGSGTGETTEYTLLDSVHLPAAITVGAAAGLATRFTANALAQGAVLGA